MVMSGQKQGHLAKLKEILLTLVFAYLNTKWVIVIDHVVDLTQVSDPGPLLLVISHIFANIFSQSSAAEI